jgi:hypothetical protein
MFISCAICPNAAVLQWGKVDPADQNSVVPVFACADHQISDNLAALRHQATCTAPNVANLPNCDCTPFNPSPPSDYKAN